MKFVALSFGQCSLNFLNLCLCVFYGLVLESCYGSYSERNVFPLKAKRKIDEKEVFDVFGDIRICAFDLFLPSVLAA